jgi:hypothetical protein
LQPDKNFNQGSKKRRISEIIFLRNRCRQRCQRLQELDKEKLIAIEQAKKIAA